MASLGNAYVNIIADAKKLKPGLDQAKNSTVAAGKAMAKALAFAIPAATIASLYALHKVMEKGIELAKEQEAVETRLGAVIKSTGQAAGINLDQMKKMAAAMQQVTTVGDEVILGGMSILATFKQVKGEAFERTTMAALDLSEVMGQDLRTSMVMLGKVMNDPIANMGALSRAGIQFTKDQKEMIKTLWEAGDIMGAQNLLLKEIESQFGGTAKAASGTYGGAVKQAANAMGDLYEQIGYVITKNKAWISIQNELKKVYEDMTSWLKSNQEVISVWSTRVAEFIKDAGVKLWEWANDLKVVVGFLYDGFSTLWTLLSAIPKGVIEFFNNVAESSRKATEEINKLNEEMKKIEPPPRTSFQEFWDYLGKLGKDIVDVYAFIGKSVGGVFAVMLSDAIATVKLIAQEFMTLGGIMWSVLKFDFKGAREGFDNLTKTSENYLKELNTNWEAYEKGISDSWDTMISNMESRLSGAALVPPTIGGEVGAAPYVDSWMPRDTEGGGDGNGGGSNTPRADMTAADLELVKQLEEEFQLAKNEQSAMDIELESGRFQQLQDMEAEHRAWEMESLVNSQEWKLAANQVYHNEALSLLKAKNAEEVKAEIEKEKFKKKLARAGFNQALNDASFFFQQMGQQSKGAFEIFKGIEIAKTIISTIEGAQLAFAAGMATGGPWAPVLAAAYAASAIAAGYARVQSIMSQTPDGGGGMPGGGGSVGTYTVSPSTGLPTTGVTDYNTMPEEEEKRGTLTINIHGDFIGDESYIDMLVEKINDADDRDVFINQTNYARDLS